MNWDFLQYHYLNTSVQSYLTFAGIIVVGLLLKRFIAIGFTKILYKIYKQIWQDYAGMQFRNLLSKPLNGFVVVILFYTAFAQITPALTRIVLIKKGGVQIDGKKIFKKYLTLEHVVDQVLLFFFLFYTIFLIARFVDYLFLIFIHRAQIDKDRGKQQLLPLLKDVFKVLIWIFGIFTVLGVVFEVNVGTIIAGLGISGIALAFAAKESLENLLASFMLMLDKPFAIGDWIKSGDIEGSVEKIGFRSTRLRTINKSVLVVPNKRLMDGNVENLSVSGVRKVTTSIKAPQGLSQYELEEMIATIRQKIRDHPSIAGAPHVFLDNLENSNTTISISYSIKLASKSSLEDVRQQINLAVYSILYPSATQ